MKLVMTFNLFQIQTYKTRWWTVYLWIYVAAGVMLAVPLALGQLAAENGRRLRVRWNANRPAF